MNENPISIHGVAADSTGLEVSKSLSPDGWRNMISGLTDFTNSHMWWWGDLLIAAEIHGVNKQLITELSKKLDKSVGTLSNAKTVCRTIPKKDRREALRYSHHFEVVFTAGTKNIELIRKWLDYAEESNCSVLDLRKEIRKSLERNQPEVRVEPDWFATLERSRAHWENFEIPENYGFVETQRLIGTLEGFINPIQVLKEKAEHHLAEIPPDSM